MGLCHACDRDVIKTWTDDCLVVIRLLFMTTAPTRISLNYHLLQANVPDDLRHLIIEISRAAKSVQHALRTTELGLAGSTNSFGEEQVTLDIVSNTLIENYLRESGLVASYISEENNDVMELSASAPYSVVFDPLDGSSLVDANLTVGSIFGVYKAQSVFGKTPREQVAAVYALYGPRTLLVYSTGNGVHEFILNEIGEFSLLREYLGIADHAKTFSPGNLPAARDNEAYMTIVQEWLRSSLKLRYSGALVSEAHHILSKGNGIFVNLAGGDFPEGKLRLFFECAPFAYLIEQAGGLSSDGYQSILDKSLTSLEERTPIIIGSKVDVEQVLRTLKL